MSFQNKNFKRKVLSTSILASLTQLSCNAMAQQEDDSNQNDSPVVSEEVVVYGIRGSIIKSIDNKRNAGSVLDSITATDIGKLPDATIADSLQRITGIQITRSGGEGTIVNIRGNGNVTTTLNGEQMLPAGSIITVTPDFADIPSTMVSGIDVLKSAQARNLVSGLGGTIDLKTNRPFMLEEGITALGKVEVTQGSLGKETDSGFSGFLGFNESDRFGATLNISHSTNYLADYYTGAEGDSWSFNATEAASFVQDNVDVNSDGDSNDVYYAFEGHMAGNRFIDRDRTGVNGAIQFAFNDAWELTGEAFYTKLDEHQYFAGFVAAQAWQNQTGWFQPDEGGATAYPNIIAYDATPNDENGTLTYETIDGNYYTFQSGLLQSRLTKTHNQTWAIEKEALNTNLELRFDNGGPLRATLRWVHGEAANDIARSIIDGYINSGSQAGANYYGPGGVPISSVNPWGYDGFPAMLPDGTPVPDSYTQIPVHISYEGDTQHWVLPDMQVDDGNGGTVTERFGSNLNRYSLTSTNLFGEFTNADLDVFRLDAEYDWGFGHVVSIDTGIRHGVREVTKDGWIGAVARTNGYGDPFLSRWKDSASQAPETLESFIEPISFTELNERGMIIQIDDFHGTTGLDSIWFVDPKAMDDPIAWHNDIYGVNITVPDAANIYELEEKTTSAYLQANLEGDLFGFNYSGNVGLRYVKTEFDILQSEALRSGVPAVFNGVEYIIDGALGVLQPDAGKIRSVPEYDDLLPAVNIAVDLSEEQVLRFAFTKTVSTHNTDQLAGGLIVNRILACNEFLDSPINVFCATGGSQNGNPYLEPNRNTNAELSYEWYFSDTGMFNFGVFWVQQNTAFENLLIERDDIADSDGVVRGYDIDTQTFTGTVPIQTQVTVNEASYTRGVEIGYQQGFDFLDGFWSGFGITANYTWSPSSSNDTDYYGEELPSGGNSEHQSNLALWYEKDGWQARIAHNYRSKMFDWNKVEGNYRFARYFAPTNYIDASVSYDLNDNLTFSLQATNLTEEHREAYFQWEENVDQRYFNERRVTAGMQYRF